MSLSLRERFHGCLLGLAVGDAVGARYEGQSPESLRREVPTIKHLMRATADELYYTDDTQMAIGVAETLADCGEMVERRLCEAFAENYEPWRGYGRGARIVLEAMEGGHDYRYLASNYFPGGSYGNGAAMRVAPVGVFFRDTPELAAKQARLASLPTHTHPLGIEGAELVCLAVAYASRVETIDRDELYDQLLSHCQTDEYRQRLADAAQIRSVDQLPALGNGINALDSAPTAIAAFALTPDSYRDTIGNAILLGGDTDTIAAMAGAIAGAHLGAAAVPAALVAKLEDSPKGRSYLGELATRLEVACRQR
ncbi:MAG: ADP-ribosylglycohydrolase family protein [Planctomycetales bacterium]|nr:ADP-ribosylglycohydrolase family protein [Planctomycetales bacterium]